MKSSHHSPMPLSLQCECDQLAMALAAVNAYMSTMARDSFKKKSPEEKQAEAAQGMAAYRAKEAAATANMLRLRALREARDAAEPPAVEDPKPAAKKPRKKIIRP